MTVPKTIGRYEILGEIGRGSMGVVYKARDPRIGRIVALKTISFAFPLGAEEEEEFLRRFFHEAQIAGGLNHPNIVTIYDVSERDKERDAYITMELVTGTNLHDLIAGGGRLPLSQVADVLAQIAAALDYAHESGVVHRDIKPANILLTESGQAKILDFGIARLETGGLTRPGRFFGTPNYMAPEQITGQEVDGRSDQFSLGVILYQLLTSEKPFGGDSVTAISYQVVNVDPPPPSKLNPSLRPPFDRIIRKTLSKNPSDRYTRCRDLADELRAAVEEWKQAHDPSAPRTLVSSTEMVGADGTQEGSVRGITFLAPRWSRLLLPQASSQWLGWAVFLFCLVILAVSPLLFTRAPSGDAAALGAIQAPGTNASAPAAASVAPEPTARLRLQLRHRFDRGRVVIRVDGREVFNDTFRDRENKGVWSKDIAVVPGERRVEVRLINDEAKYDEIDGAQVTFKHRETTEMRASRGRFSGRLKIRGDGEEEE